MTTHVAPSPSAAAQAGGPQVTAQTDIRGWAVEVRGRLRAAGALDDVEYALRLRAEVAAHLIEVRKIAKVETLRYRWPDAARLALQNRLSIVEVEEHLGRLQTSPERPAVFTSDEARDLYALSEQDRQFRRFLRLRPHFVDIPFFQYLSASPLPDAVTTATPATSPGPQAGTPTVAQSASQRSAPDAQQIRGDPSTPPTQGEVTPTPTTTPAIEQTPPPARTTPAAYETYVFKLHSVTDRAAGGGIVGYSAGIRFPDGSEGSGPAEIGSKLFEEVYTKSIGVPPDQRVQQFLSRMFARQDTEYLFRLVRAGQALFGGVFGRLWKALEANDVFNKNKIVKAPGAETSARVVIETDDARVAESWPWEWLAFPDQRDLFMMGEKHSLVRAFPRSVPVPEKQLNPPLRILVVAPSYSADTLEDSKLRVEFLKELFPQQTPSEAPPPKLMILSGDEVTEERLHNAIFDFIPHVLHFEGRVGGYEAADNSRENLFLFLSYRDGSHEQLSVPRFEQMLNSAEVQLMVIEPGPYVTFIGWEALAFCKGLMAGALPAAVMPVREVGDATVGEFLRGFYRALLEGQTLEAAVSKARLGLLGRGGDWTAFALFSDPETLDKSRLVPPTA